MKQKWIRLLTVAGLLGVLTVAPMGKSLAVETDTDTAREALVRGNSAFAVELYGQLRQREGNLFFSPYSISVALAMVYAGARGKTEQQMQDVLHFEAGQEHLHAALAALTREMEPPQGDPRQLVFAQRLWGKKGYPFLEMFLALTEEHYGAELARTIFPEPGRKEINTWVARKTAGKVEELIKDGFLDDRTVLALVNAVYFKSQWAFPFRDKSTRDREFFVTPDKAIQVPTLYRGNVSFPYAEDEEVQTLVLPYARKECSMVILLPRKKDGLPRLEESLTPAELSRRLSLPTKQEKIEVYLPRFTIHSDFRLLKTLKTMGLTDVDDFRGMTGDLSLFLGAVVHGAFVRVDEKGTEAAAATAAIMKVRSTRTSKKRPVFRADHPFLFLIRDEKTGSILFVGRVRNPKQ
jgi:serine protease inhibitor